MTSLQVHPAEPIRQELLPSLRLPQPGVRHAGLLPVEPGNWHVQFSPHGFTTLPQCLPTACCTAELLAPHGVLATDLHNGLTSFSLHATSHGFVAVS